MKEDIKSKTQSKIMIGLFSLLGLLMITTLVIDNFTSKGTYSADSGDVEYHIVTASSYSKIGYTCTKTSYIACSGVSGYLPKNENCYACQTTTSVTRKCWCSETDCIWSTSKPDVDYDERPGECPGNGTIETQTTTYSLTNTGSCTSADKQNCSHLAGYTGNMSCYRCTKNQPSPTPSESTNRYTASNCPVQGCISSSLNTCQQSYPYCTNWENMYYGEIQNGYCCTKMTTPSPTPSPSPTSPIGTTCYDFNDDPVICRSWGCEWTVSKGCFGTIDLTTHTDTPVCAINYYLDANANKCYKCPDGYKSSGGATPITGCYITCEANTYLPYSSASSCIQCPSGKTSQKNKVYYGSSSTCTSSNSRCTNLGEFDTATECRNYYTGYECKQVEHGTNLSANTCFVKDPNKCIDTYHMDENNQCVNTPSTSKTRCCCNVNDACYNLTATSCPTPYDLEDTTGNKCNTGTTTSCARINNSCRQTAKANCENGYTGCTTCVETAYTCNAITCTTNGGASKNECIGKADVACGTGNWTGCQNAWHNEDNTISCFSYSCGTGTNTDPDPNLDPDPDSGDTNDGSSSETSQLTCPTNGGES